MGDPGSFRVFYRVKNPAHTGVAGVVLRKKGAEPFLTLPSLAEDCLITSSFSSYFMSNPVG
jgi:hypothetical protein